MKARTIAVVKQINVRKHFESFLCSALNMIGIFKTDTGTQLKVKEEAVGRTNTPAHFYIRLGPPFVYIKFHYVFQFFALRCCFAKVVAGKIAQISNMECGSIVKKLFPKPFLFEFSAYTERRSWFKVDKSRIGAARIKIMYVDRGGER